ncbi:hypothetical protein ACP4OV_023228 [Aristida adscensionis]
MAGARRRAGGRCLPRRRAAPARPAAPLVGKAAPFLRGSMEPRVKTSSSVQAASGCAAAPTGRSPLRWPAEDSAG